MPACSCNCSGLLTGHSHETTAESLPAIQRSVFGASARMVSDVAHALARDYGLEVR